MSDNVFQFNWRGMTREPSYPYSQSQDGAAQARAAYIAQQAANMQGYNPLPNMQGYTPDMQIGTDSTPGIIHGRQLNQQGGFRSPTGLGMVNTGTGMEYTNREARKEELMEQLKANEDRINKLTQEYQQLQQEQETATEYLERNVAANRAGIGDTSQYNAWRARVEAREASKQAREADSAATLRTAKSRLNNALLARSYARGDKEKAAAQQVYEDELAAYNELAKKLGAPEISASELPDEKTYTRGDVEKMILEHRNEMGEWDSTENKNMTVAAAKTLPDADMIAVLKDIFGNITQAEGDAKRKAFMNKVKKEVEKLKAKDPASGDHTITVDGKEYTVTIKGVDAGNKYGAFFKGKMIGDPWEA